MASKFDFLECNISKIILCLTELKLQLSIHHINVYFGNRTLASTTILLLYSICIYYICFKYKLIILLYHINKKEKNDQFTSYRISLANTEPPGQHIHTYIQKNRYRCGRFRLRCRPMGIKDNRMNYYLARNETAIVIRRQILQCSINEYIGRKINHPLESILQQTLI